MHAQTLRTYDRLGLVSPQRSSGGGRRYSEHDVDLLREVQRLSQDEGVNLAGIKRIIELTNQVEALQSRLGEMADEVDRLRANQRRDLAVVPKSTALVVWQPAARARWPLGHLDREPRRLRLARDREAVVAAAQRVGRRGHRFDADDVVVARREELRGGITLLERHLDAAVAAGDGEHRTRRAPGRIRRRTRCPQRLGASRPSRRVAPVGRPRSSTGRCRIVGVVSSHSSRGTPGIRTYGW